MDGKRQRFVGPSFAIGRQETNDLSLALDPTVSNQHARILRDGTNYWLEDLGSRNGTFLSDERISSRVLIGPGILFFVGQTCLEFLPR